MVFRRGAQLKSHGGPKIVLLMLKFLHIERKFFFEEKSKLIKRNLELRGGD
jgi:hypothetical protein